MKCADSRTPTYLTLHVVMLRTSDHICLRFPTCNHEAHIDLHVGVLPTPIVPTSSHIGAHHHTCKCDAHIHLPVVKCKNMPTSPTV